jgi:hypothetical protein
MSESVGTILILAVVAMFEGVRRLPPDAFVLRRLLGQWNAATPLELGRDWFLIAWPIPVVLGLVVARDAGDESVGIGRAIARMHARARRTRVVIAALRAWGTVILLFLVVGLPLATLRWDLFGLTVSVEILFLLCAIQALMTHIGLRRAGSTRRAALWASAKMLWPFSAPTAAEAVQTQVVRGAPWILVLVELLGRERFLVEMRTGLYDELEKGGVNGVVAALYGRETIAAFLRRPADGVTPPFCPRCGAEYRSGIEQCANCEGVALIA